MAETSAPDPKSRKPLWSRPIGRVAFWVCGAIAVVAFGAAVVAAGEDGWQGLGIGGDILEIEVAPNGVQVRNLYNLDEAKAA